MSALMQAADTRYLWYLGSPSSPVPIGELRLLVQSRGVSLRYADSWLMQGSSSRKRPSRTNRGSNTPP